MRDNYYIIDSHCHIYPDKIAAKAAQSTSDFYKTQGFFDGTLGKLLAESERAGVDRLIVQSVATTPAQVSGINRYIAGVVAAGGGRIIGLGSLHPDSEDIDGDIRLIQQLGLKGVKLHADIQKIAINDPRCYKIYERLEGKLPVLMHTGDKRFNFSNPDNLVPVLEDFKNLTVIGAHFGGWSVWEEAAAKLSGYENFYVDTSSTLTFTDIGFVKNLLPRYDVNRVLFGADYPMWRQKEDIDALLALGLPKESYRKIFSENAVRLYGL